MIIDITNEIFTKLKTQLVGVTTLTSFPNTKPKFPCVIFEEIDNTTLESSIDTSGEKHNSLVFEVNIFSDANNKMTICRNLAQEVDGVLSDYYGLTRTSSERNANFGTFNLYKYMIRYSCVVDENKKIYRR